MTLKTSLPVEVQFGDCDPAQIVFYPNFFRWFDASTWHLFRSVGLTLPLMRERYGPRGIPLVDARSTFIAACWPGDALAVESAITEWRRTSFVLAHRVVRGGEPIADGSEIRVWALDHPERPADLKAGPIPSDVIALLAG